MSIETVGDWIRELQRYPEEWKVKVSTPAGGGIAIEHREVGGEPVIAVFGSNGGRFGENPLTEAEYQKRAKDFKRFCDQGYVYTSIHGDHRLYNPTGSTNATCYGVRFDSRVIERMVKDELLSSEEVDVERVRSCTPKSLVAGL